ncbi:uncharacterized protein LOC120355503 [Nilaparvata lugens]|uniref:uncharacterized protein LOC120355503 n=1 Tax=Nilaparvata lugens TaxID=108931 RepID=UPI00193D884A|nr:uncharacterized protein LOC120355503 [Nilaparvata lugens]
MEETIFLKKYINLLCYDKPNNSLPFLLFLVLAVVTLTNILLAILDESDADVFKEGIKDIFTLTLVFSCTVEQSLNPQRALNLVQLIDDDFLVNQHDFVDRQDTWARISKLHATKIKSIKKKFQYLSCFFILIFVGYFFKHLFNHGMRIAVVSDESSRLLTPFLLYRLQQQTSESSATAFFIYAYCLHVLAVVSICSEGYVVVSTACLSSEKLLGDFETFFLLLDCLTNDFSDSSTDHVDDHSLGSKEANLRKDMALVVRCHQNINRKFRICAANSAFAITATIAVFVNDSVFAFFMLKAKSAKRAVSFALMLIVENVTMFLIYQNGQRIFNQNDKLRKCLAGLPWINKPRWFRQTVLNMMTRANVDTEMRPYGIFVLNYMSFKDLMKLTFSVGNVLYTTKLANQSQQ